jgi:hypothetical protein
MARKHKSAENRRKIHYLRIDRKDIDINWLHTMRTPEEKKRDAEVEEWFKQQLPPHSGKLKKLQSQD